MGVSRSKFQSQSKSQFVHGHTNILSHSSSVRTVAFSPDGHRIVSGNDDNSAVVSCVSDGTTSRKLSGHSGRVDSVAWSPSGDYVITGSGDKYARIWNSVTGNLLTTLEGHTDCVVAVAWSPRGDHVATASDDRKAMVWNPETGVLIHTMRQHSAWVNAVAFAPDGRSIVTGSADNTAIITQIDDNTNSIRIIGKHLSAVYAVAYSPGGDRVATGSADKMVRIWDVTTGNILVILSGHSNTVRSVAWSTRGDFVLSGSWDQTARIWSVATGETLQTFAHHTNWVSGVAWSPGGDRIATASYDGTVQVISISPNQNSASAEINDADDSDDIPNSKAIDKTVHSSELPQRRCFKRTKTISFDEALTKLLRLRECPTGRSDLQDEIPDDDDIKMTLKEVEAWYEKIQSRADAKRLISAHGLTPDEVKAILCFSMENPFRVYAWLNGWLMTDRRDNLVKSHVGPFFVLLYRGMEKLPRMRCKASRGVYVQDIKALRDTFEGYRTVCKRGNTLGFWSLASFSTNDDVLAQYAGGHTKDAIVYACEDLECVSIWEFSRFPKEEEVLPLPPSSFKVLSSQRLERKLVIGLEQMDHDDIAYVLPANQNEQ